MIVKMFQKNQTNENDSVIKIGSPNFINDENSKIRNIIFQLGIRNTVKDEYDIGMYSRLRSFFSLYGWRPWNSGYTAEFQL